MAKQCIRAIKLVPKVHPDEFQDLTHIRQRPLGEAPAVPWKLDRRYVNLRTEGCSPVVKDGAVSSRVRKTEEFEAHDAVTQWDHPRRNVPRSRAA
jgi:hypothetical protein